MNVQQFGLTISFSTAKHQAWIRTLHIFIPSPSKQNWFTQLLTVRDSKNSIRYDPNPLVELEWMKDPGIKPVFAFKVLSLRRVRTFLRAILGACASTRAWPRRWRRVRTELRVTFAAVARVARRNRKTRCWMTTKSTAPPTATKTMKSRRRKTMRKRTSTPPMLRLPFWT